MTTIRVDTQQLRRSAAIMLGLSQDASELASKAWRLAASAPSYDGQFGPEVQAIGAEAVSRIGALAAALTARADFLRAKAEAFDAADTALVEGLDDLLKRLVDLTQDPLSLDVLATSLQWLNTYLALSILAARQPSPPEPPEPEWQPPWWAPIVLGLSNGFDWYNRNINQPIYDSLATWKGIAENGSLIAQYYAAQGWFWYHEHINEPIYDSVRTWQGIRQNASLLAQYYMAQGWSWYDSHVNQPIYDSIATWQSNLAMWDVIWNQKLHAVQQPGLPPDGPITPALRQLSSLDARGNPVSPVGAELAALIDNRGGVTITFADSLTAGGTAGVAPFAGSTWLPNRFADPAIQAEIGNATLVGHELGHVLQRDLAEFPDGYAPAGIWPFNQQGNLDPANLTTGAPLGRFTLYMEVLSNITEKTVHYDLLNTQLANLPPGDPRAAVMQAEMAGLANSLATYTGNPSSAVGWVVQEHGGYGMYTGEMAREILTGSGIPSGGWDHWMRQQGFSEQAIQHIRDVAVQGTPQPVNLGGLVQAPAGSTATATPTTPATPTLTPTPSGTPSATPTATPSATTSTPIPTSASTTTTAAPSTPTPTSTPRP